MIGWDSTKVMICALMFTWSSFERVCSIAPTIYNISITVDAWNSVVSVIQTRLPIFPNRSVLLHLLHCFRLF